MLRTLSVFPILFLACCTSPTELAKMPPTEAFDTSAKPSSIRDCIILPQPEKYTAIPVGEGWQVTIPGAQISAFSITLTPISKGTHVEVRKAKAIARVGWQEEIQSCLDKAPRL